MREWRERLLSDAPLDASGCWVWQGRIDENGYGRTTYGRELEQLAHRLSYRLFRGDIPEGLTLDHLCRKRDCVNPEHLEAVTLVENIMRGDGICARRARATHCDRGHAFTNENTYRFPDGRRCCRRCRLDKQRERRGKVAA